MGLFQDFKGMGFGKILYLLLVGHPIRAVFLYRLSAWFYWRRLRPVASFLRYLNVSLHGCDISPDAKIGPGFRLLHTVGVVIGVVQAGSNLSVYQNVTMGNRGTASGELVYGFPVLGDGISVYAGAVLLGPIRVGDNAKVAANSIVLQNVPAAATVAGVPATVVRRREE